MSSPNAQAAQGGDTEPQAEALFDCKGWTIEVTSLYARGVDLTKKEDDGRRQEVRAGPAYEGIEGN